MDDVRHIAEVFNNSYARITQGSDTLAEAFFRDFYGLLLDSSDEARIIFQGTDLSALARMLRISVGYLLVFYTSGETTPHITHIAERHGKHGKDVSPDLYDVWLGSLIGAVAMHDPQFNLEVSEAWKSVFGKGIKFMISHAR